MDLPKEKPILCVDFDGVIHSYSSGWKGARCIPDPPVQGAFDFLVEAVEHFQVCIYSSRSRYLFGRWAMKKWLKKWFFELAMAVPEFDHEYALHKWVSHFAFADPWEDEVRWGAYKLVDLISFPTQKPPAFLQIDDRAITFTGKFPNIDEIKQFKPWNKRK